jgi:hypothetical protein
MKIYKFDANTNQVIAEEVGDKATINIPFVGSYEYGDEGMPTKAPSSNQAPTWNFNNPLKKWQFPILSKIIELVSPSTKDPINQAPTPTNVSGIPDLNNDGVSNVLDLILQQQQGSVQDPTLGAPQGPGYADPSYLLIGQDPSKGQALSSGLTDLNNDGVVNMLDELIQRGTAQLQGSTTEDSLNEPFDLSSDFPHIADPDDFKAIDTGIEGQSIPPIPIEPAWGNEKEIQFYNNVLDSLEIRKEKTTSESNKNKLDKKIKEIRTKLNEITGEVPIEKEDSVKVDIKEPKVDSTDYGLFQINDKWHDKEAQEIISGSYKHPKDMSSIEQISYAWNLFNKEGWDVWTSYNNGAYEKYLDWTDRDYKDNDVSSHDLRRIDLFFNNPDGSGSPENARIAKAIMFAESGGDRKSVNVNTK